MDRTETYELIIQKADSLFRRFGMKTSVAAIAGELSMSPANIYKFFPSKRAIIEAVSERRMAAAEPRLIAVRPNGLDDAPQYRLHIDREKARALGVAISDVNTTIQGAFASAYVNQFTRSGRVKQVYVQGEPDARMLPTDLAKWYVRNASGSMDW